MTLTVTILLACVAGDLLPAVSRSLVVRQLIGAGGPEVFVFEGLYVQPAIWLLSVSALISLSLRARRLARDPAAAE